VTGQHDEISAAFGGYLDNDLSGRSHTNEYVNGQLSKRRRLSDFA
jgi:hypothetical protein